MFLLFILFESLSKVTQVGWFLHTSYYFSNTNKEIDWVDPARDPRVKKHVETTHNNFTSFIIWSIRCWLGRIRCYGNIISLQWVLSKLAGAKAGRIRCYGNIISLQWVLSKSFTIPRFFHQLPNTQQTRSVVGLEGNAWNVDNSFRKKLLYRWLHLEVFFQSN